MTSPDVAVVYVLGNAGEKLLQITDSVGKIYKYYRVSTMAERVSSTTIGGTGMADIGAELERWRTAIDKVRGRL
jgi:hypothetical protein